MNAPQDRATPPVEDWPALLSALADGEAAALPQACNAWRDDPKARASWHAYHLIGDVMRSEDLATEPARDAAFLTSLRTRLAEEPVVLAPTVPGRRRQFWMLPAAAAAGFVMVAGVMVVVRTGAHDANPALVAAARAPSAALTLAGATAAPAVPTVIEGRMIRDPQLDRYLQAHRSMVANGAVAVPGGAPRSVEVLAPIEPAARPLSR